MGRSRRSAKQAGASFERLMADYFALALDDDRIDRRVKTGAKDRGDIAGLRMRGKRVVVECKDYGGRHRLPEWLKEAETERGNDDAEYGVVAWKRLGVRDPAKQYVTMTAETFMAMVAGGRDLLGQDS